MISNGLPYRKAPKTTLRAATRLRHELVQIRRYLVQCSRASGLLAMVDDPPHLATDPDVYSLDQLVAAKSGALVSRLELVVQACTDHIEGCPLCSAKGYICEICNSDEVLFPFQSSDVVVQCQTCQTVYHRACWDSSGASRNGCLKCARIEAYRAKRKGDGGQ